MRHTHFALAALSAAAIAGFAGQAGAAQTLSSVGLIGQMSDAFGNQYAQDGGVAWLGLSGGATLSYTSTNAVIPISQNVHIVIIDGGVVDGSHLITFEYQVFPQSPFHFNGNPGSLRITGKDTNGNPVGVDSVLNVSPSGVQQAGDFWGPVVMDGAWPEITSFTLDFDVPEPATWALLLMGAAGVGASLRMRRRALRAA